MYQHEFPFQWGVFQGNETVLDCIGRNTSPIALRLLLPWILNVQKRQMELIAKLGEEEDEFKGRSRVAFNEIGNGVTILSHY